MTSGVTHRRLKVTKKTIDFGKPRGACDIDDWLLAQNPYTFSRMLEGEATFKNSGLLLGYVDGTPELTKEGTFTYDEAICGFTWQNTAVFAGTEAAWNTQSHPELSDKVTGMTIGAVISHTSPSIPVGSGMLIAGIKDTDTGDYRLALVLQSGGSVACIVDGDLFISGMSVISSEPAFVAVSISRLGAVKMFAAGASIDGDTTAPAVMAYTSRFEVGACVEASAVVSSKSQTGISVVPFVGRIERAFFTKSALSDRTASIAHRLVVLKTYYDPAADYESSSSA